MLDLTISIVTYNNPPEQLERVIQSVKKTKLNYRLFISDNSETNKIESFLNHERIEYIFNNSNKGFGHGHNVVIHEIQNQSKYHLVLNPDVVFEAGILEAVFNYMEANKDTGLLIPQIFNSDKTPQYLPQLLPSPLSIVLRKLPLAFLNQTFLNRYELRALFKQTHPVAIVSGCFSFFRVSDLKKVGGYDEHFFMYFEDFDISRRINKIAKLVSFADVNIIHDYERGASKKWFLTKAFFRSMFYYFNKWGWFFDKERTQTNNIILQTYHDTHHREK